HSWAEPEEERFYTGRQMLDLLERRCTVESDFPWGVAYHPYPRSLFVPETWRDPQTPATENAPYVTFRNIEVLAAWARNPDHGYLGRPRDVYLTEQGFHSRDYTDKELRLQAAAMAYAWKKAAALPEIRGIHYHNWIDNRHEGGLRIGLRRYPDDADAPGAPKPIWELYRALGTPQEIEACSFARDVILEDSPDLRDEIEALFESPRAKP
ncbi:MAG: hypothetical protein KDA61_05150, partial [Planctomycetales bacterium]|nr:hypothetical protein [Planctomycetales bacterium]